MHYFFDCYLRLRVRKRESLIKTMVMLVACRVEANTSLGILRMHHLCAFKIAHEGSYLCSRIYQMNFCVRYLIQPIDTENARNMCGNSCVGGYGRPCVKKYLAHVCVQNFTFISVTVPEAYQATNDKQSQSWVLQEADRTKLLNGLVW